VRSLLSEHVFIGALLVPPIALKMTSTSYRFARYYMGDPAYARKGPPPWLLRLLGPIVVGLTVVLFASGFAVLFAGRGWHQRLLFIHKASFFIWFATMTIHVLGHLRDSVTLGVPDWTGTARPARAAWLRRGLLLGSLGVGAAAGALLLSRVSPYLAAFGHRFRG
jgi:hypothetical protein